MNKIGQKEMAKLKKDPESVGHEIKENTELAEHETGVQNLKKSTKSVFNKMKETL
jgi:hypothetical protein